MSRMGVHKYHQIIGDPTTQLARYNQWAADELVYLDITRDEDSGYDVRGGGWSNEPAYVRCAVRNADPPKFGHSNLGFRVALHRKP
jgi:formylglycine-generating enzyme required for sulfatase activity